MRELEQQIEAARILLGNLKDVLEGDAELLTGTLEGETNLFEIMEHAVQRLAEIDAMTKSLTTTIDTFVARRQRLKEQAAHIRTSLLGAMDLANLKSRELPSATITRKATAQSVVITNESVIPAKYWEPAPPKLNKKMLLDDLKAAKPIDGASLSNAPDTIQVRHT